MQLCPHHLLLLLCDAQAACAAIGRLVPLQLDGLVQYQAKVLGGCTSQLSYFGLDLFLLVTKCLGILVKRATE